jgi:hypothetical protein
MVSLEYIIFPVITLFAVTLIIASLLAYQKSKNKKMLFLTFVFILFVIKGLLISIDLFIDVFTLHQLFTFGGILDAFAMVTLYLLTLKV